MYRSVEVCTFMYRSVEVCTFMYRSVEVCTFMYRSVEVCTGVSRSVHSGTGVHFNLSDMWAVADKMHDQRDRFILLYRLNILLNIPNFCYPSLFMVAVSFKIPNHIRCNTI